MSQYPYFLKAEDAVAHYKLKERAGYDLAPLQLEDLNRVSMHDRVKWFYDVGVEGLDVLVEKREESMDHKTISVQRFRSPDGAPTCCADHHAGQTCRFLGVRNFGVVDVCMLGEQRDLAPRTTDFQRPDARCEVWADA